MEKVDVKCGFLCNNRCRFCVQGDKRQEYGDIPTDEIIKTIEEARKESDAIVFTGGEVTTKKDFLRFVSRAKSLEYQVIQIQTNGRMFSSEEFSRETVFAGANDFNLALHGSTPELHDYLTMVPGSFYQTVKGIRNLKKLGQHVGTNTVINRSNYRDLPCLAELLVHLNVNQFQLAFIHALGSAAKNFKQIVPRYYLIMEYVKQALETGINSGQTVMTEAIPLCFLDEYRPFAAEYIIPMTKIYDVNIMEDYTEYRITEGKTKHEKCISCLWNHECEGPWKEYPEYYGWDEFIPVINTIG